jgi:branched-chain amino acid transport system permease protein
MLPSGIFNINYQKDIAIVRTKTQWFLLALGLIFLFTLQLYCPAYWLNWLILLGVWIIAALGVHILTGLCGQITLGHFAFVAAGAYTTAILMSKVTWMSPWLALPLAGIVAGLIGLLFGAPSLRIKGFYLAMSTIAAQFILLWLIRHFSSLTGGSGGVYVEPFTLGGIDFGDVTWFYGLTVFLVIVMTVFAKNLQRTHIGRIFIAVRDNDLAAEVMGVNLFRYKLLAFFIGCFFAGIAGWLWANYMGRITPEQFDLQKSIWVLGMLIVGGAGSTTGAIFGAISIRLLDVLIDNLTPIISDLIPAIGAQFYSAAGLIFFALIVMIFLIFEPRGLYHRWEIFKSSYRLHPYSY